MNNAYFSAYKMQESATWTYPAWKRIYGEYDMKATIKDIAKETGLSLATVSKYLNDRRISDQSRVLIKEAIERLDYHPNHTAQKLRSKKTRTVAILISNLANYFWGSLLASVCHFFMQSNYAVITCSFNCSEEEEGDVIQSIISQHVDGVIMLPNNMEDSRYHIFQEAGIPVVLLDQYPTCMEQYPVDLALTNNYKGGELLGNYLLEKGHRDIYIVERALNSYTVSQRILGFSSVYERERISFEQKFPPFVFTDHETVTDLGRQYLRQLLKSPERPGTIFFTNYLTALGGLMEINELGYSIPEDLSIVIFDDDLLFAGMYPPITCVAQDLDGIGKRASATLLQRMEGDYSDFPRTDFLDVIFRERRSVKDLSVKV